MNYIFSFLISFLVAHAASASFYQVECSNGDGSVRMSSGHVSNKWVIQVDPPVGSQMDKYYLELKPNQLDVTTSDNQEVYQNSEKKCSPGYQFGIAEWKKVTTKHVEISRKDGTPFPEGYAVSRDGYTVEAYLICEENGNSQALCD